MSRLISTIDKSIVFLKKLRQKVINYQTKSGLQRFGTIYSKSKEISIKKAKAHNEMIEKILEDYKK